jgi:hypothetical protein
MERVEAIRLVIQLHEEMKQLILKSGVKESKYQSILELIDDPETDVVEVHTWLTEVRFGPYDLVLRVWERHTPETWSNLTQLLGVHDLAEQKLLRKHLINLRQTLNGSPYAREKKHTSKSERPSEGSREVHFRSESDRANEGGC